MFKRLNLAHILVVCAVVIVSCAVYVTRLPDINKEFRTENASFDTTPFASYAHGQVTEVVFEDIGDGQRNKSISQELKVLLSDTEHKGEQVTIQHTAILDKAASVQYKQGDKVILGLLPSGIDREYVIVDRDRLTGVYIVIVIFILLALVVGRLKGMTSLVGLAITGSILIFFIAPQILNGKDPFLVALVGAGMILLVSMFISHGFNRRTQISALSTLASLVIAAAGAYAAVYLTKLFGFGQGDAFLLETGYLGTINLQGILLAGIVISVLGVLDDVTTSQTAAVDELKKANPSLSVKELYSRGLSVGREHIASLINTLILVYAGAALPLFLLLTLQKSQPIWLLLNSEFVAEELVRSLIGSMALILAVPISTFLAAYIFSRNNSKDIGSNKKALN
jgi:uncharacterized membrane protein